MPCDSRSQLRHTTQRIINPTLPDLPAHHPLPAQRLGHVEEDSRVQRLGLQRRPGGVVPAGGCIRREEEGVRLDASGCRERGRPAAAYPCRRWSPSTSTSRWAGVTTRPPGTGSWRWLSRVVVGCDLAQYKDAKRPTYPHVNPTGRRWAAPRPAPQSPSTASSPVAARPRPASPGCL